MGKVKELEDEIPEYNPDTHRWDMDKKKLIAFTPEELAAIARERRKTDLEKRFKLLMRTNRYYRKVFPYQYEDLPSGRRSIHHQEEIDQWDRDDLDDFEQKVLKIEAAKKEMEEEAERERPMLDRRNEYRKIDELLLEALAEKEENKAGKMEEYLKLRSAIKEKFPK